MLNQFEQVVFLLNNGADYTIKSIGGGSVAYWIQDGNPNKGTSQYKWQQKAKKILEDGGIKFPVSK